MTVRGRSTNAVSLAAELAVLARAVNGLARFLDVEEAGVVTEDHQREAVALLGLLGARLWQLRRASVGAQDPKSLLAPFNEADAPRAGDDPDIRLRLWSGGAARRSGRKGG